jgi:hypothetical protein
MASQNDLWTNNDVERAAQNSHARCRVSRSA